jgi:predicted amidohydrolase
MLAAMRCEKGDIEGNLRAHRDLLAQAASAGQDLVLFPEMSLTGSVHPATNPERLVPADHRAIIALAEATRGTLVGACFGVAERLPGGDSCITQVFAAGGRVAGLQRKRHLGEGEEAFTAGSEAAVYEHAGVRFGVAICAESGYEGPFDSAAAAGASLVLFPAAPGLHGRRTSAASWQAGLAWWESCGLADACRHARRLGLWVALAGQAGSTADEDFPGLAALVGPDGQVTARLPDWRAGTLTVEIPLGG